MKTKSKISGHILRGSATALLFLCGLVALSSAINLPNHAPKIPAPQSNTAFGANGRESASSVAQRGRTLTFADRVAYQRAIEEVYWRHRIWPKERADAKPSLDAVMSQGQLENKVADYLRKSHALQDYWQRPMTAEQLQAEMDRMAKHTKQPEVLRELFEAVGNDPFVIAECLARPTLAERSLVVAQEEEPLESLPAEGETEPPNAIAAPSDEYILPDVPDVGGCINDTWTATSTANAPASRESQTAVWTGSEMIVWGGFPYSNTGGRYNPSTDTWVATSTTNAPAGRESQTAVWTGSEMIVWGGVRGRNYNQQYLNTGGRYNPSTNSWVATSTINAPAGRYDHTAVWTGNAMIVWGGVGIDYFNTGGRYNPNTNSWTATSTINAPAGRYDHTAVWTGSEMIVWGGYGADPANPRFLNTGARYNPSNNSWTRTSITNAPTARYRHTAVWTGTKMIVWGGSEYYNIYDNTGGRYNPTTNSWTATSTANAPTGRAGHTARWTGSEMIVWGGEDLTNFFNTGGRYSPSMDTWTATGTTTAPSGRIGHRAVWTGSEMIVWGGGNNSGLLNTGGRYCANGPPLVITNPATLIASFSAALIGSVNPHGLTTTVYFEYGTTTSYGSTTASRTKTGNAYQSVSVNINGLSASTTYYFRIVATNSAGTRYGSDRTFTTLSATGPPVVTTNPATNVATSSATLYGSLDPHGLAASVYFQYGTTTNYGHATTMQQGQTGNTFRNISANISGLSAHTTYHFRIVATNSGGTRFGGDRTFTTH